MEYHKMPYLFHRIPSKDVGTLTSRSLTDLKTPQKISEGTEPQWTVLRRSKSFLNFRHGASRQKCNYLVPNCFSKDFPPSDASATPTLYYKTTELKETLSSDSTIYATITLTKDRSPLWKQKEVTRKRHHFKPAPYDYKVRFAVLQDKHFTLQAACGKLTKRYSKLRKMMSQFQKDHEDFQNTLKDCLISKKFFFNLKYELENEQRKNEMIQVKLNMCRRDYKDLNTKLITVSKLTVHLTYENEKLLDQIKLLKQELQEKNSSIDNFKNKLCVAAAEKRQLHNIIQDIKGNIRVFCRIRPPLSSEASKGLLRFNYKNQSTVLEIDSKIKAESVSGSPKSFSKQKFCFDKIFNQDSTQKQVFDELSQLIETVLNGYNVCIFAYGQTGSGKTYTMEGGGTEHSLGMIPLTVDFIFDSIQERETLNWIFEVKVSVLEIYNEHIYDLLDDEKNLETHEIRMADPKGTNLIVTNQKIIVVQSKEELNQILKIAQQKRSVASTMANINSSRSHLVTKIQMNGSNKLINEYSNGSLNLIDLAGSERPHDPQEVRFTETRNINKSLAQLSNVILAIFQKSDYIPFRNSKLTHLLMPSLRGNSKTLMIVNISPLVECYNETLKSLRFASQVNHCKVTNIN